MYRCDTSAAAGAEGDEMSSNHARSLDQWCAEQVLRGDHAAGRPCVPCFPPQPPTPAAVSWTANMPRWRRFGRLTRPPVTRTRRRVTIKLTLAKLPTTTAATVVAAVVAVIGVIIVATTTGEQPV